MPTEFTDCNECSYLEGLGLDHELNKDHKTDCEKLEQLLKTGLSRDQCIEKIKNLNIMKQCNYCHETIRYRNNEKVVIRNKLCETHYVRACKFGTQYRGSGAMCDSCCWHEI